MQFRYDDDDDCNWVGPGSKFLDIYKCEQSKLPLLVFIHGGLWVSRDKKDYANVGQYFAENGVTTAVINYRLSGNGLQHPEHVKDCASALNWLFEEKYATHGIVLLGHSCGATMSAMLQINGEHYGLKEAPKKAIVGIIGIAGIYDMHQYILDFAQWLPEVEVSQGSDQSKWEHPTQQLKLVAGNRQLRTKWLVIHQPGDSLVNIRQAQDFAKLMTEDSDNVELDLSLPGDHFDAVHSIGTGTPLESLVLTFMHTVAANH